MKHKKFASLLLIGLFVLTPLMVKAETQAECIAKCDARWFDLCPAIALDIFNALVARGIPNANATYQMLLRACNVNHRICIARCLNE